MTKYWIPPLDLSTTRKALANPSVSLAGKLVMAWLIYRSEPYGSISWDQDSQKQVAFELGTSVQKIRAAVKELLKIGYIEKAAVGDDLVFIFHEDFDLTYDA